MEKNVLMRHLKAFVFGAGILLCLTPIMNSLTEIMLSELGYGVSHVALEKVGVILYLFVVTVTYAIVYLLHRRYRAQTEEHPIFINYVKKLFSWSVGVVVGIVAGMFVSVFLFVLGVALQISIFLVIFDEMWIIGYLVLAIIIGSGGYLLAERIIRREKHKMKKADWIGCGEFVLVLFLCFGTWYGLAQVEERYVPVAAEVESASVIMNQKWMLLGESSRDEIKVYDEECLDIIEFHNQMLENLSYFEQLEKEKAYRDANLKGETVKIEYTMKNGDTVIRNYRIPKTGAGLEILNDLIEYGNSPENFMRKAIFVKYDEIDAFESGDVRTALYTLWRDRAIIGAEEIDLALNQQECMRLYQAIIADAMAGNLAKYNAEYLISLEEEEMEGEEEKKYYISMKFQNPEDENKEETIRIRYGRECTNILNELVRLGYAKSVEHFCWEDVASVEKEDEVYLDEVFCYEYEKIDILESAHVEFGPFDATENGEMSSDIYIQNEPAKVKELYDSIVRDWIDGKLIKYNAVYYELDCEEEWYDGKDNVYTIAITFVVPGTSSYKTVNIYYGSDCENIINTIASFKELGLD